MSDIEAALKERWYYTVELQPERYTNGFSFKNIAPTRRVLEAINFAGASVLDISTMEGMFSILMARRGAKVTATDSINLSSKIALLQSIYQSKFDYLSDFPVKNFADQMFSVQASRSFSHNKPLRQNDVTPFGYDVVLSSGLIYHVLNPIDHILTYRQLCKLGGLCVIESAVLLSDEIEIVHDWRGSQKVFGGNATWFISTRALEVFLKACFFEPLAYSWVTSADYGDRKLARLAVLSRAVDERPFSSAEYEIAKGSELYKNYDFKPLYQSAQLTGRVANALSVDLNLPELHAAGDMNGSSVCSTLPVNYIDRYLSLSLRDT